MQSPVLTVSWWAVDIHPARTHEVVHLLHVLRRRHVGVEALQVSRIVPSSPRRSAERPAWNRAHCHGKLRENDGQAERVVVLLQLGAQRVERGRVDMHCQQVWPCIVREVREEFL